MGWWSQIDAVRFFPSKRANHRRVSHRPREAYIYTLDSPLRKQEFEGSQFLSLPASLRVIS